MPARRVTLDATPLAGPGTGVARFVAGALTALRRRPDLEVATYSLTVRAGAGDGQHVRLPPRLLHQLWLRADWPRLPLRPRPDVVHGTNFVVPPGGPGTARVATVHDLTTLRFPELATAATRPFPDLVRRAVARGAWVHTPSSFVAAEVVDLLGADPARVRSVPHGLTPPGPPVDRRPPYPFPYVLALGTVEPRKDLPTLVRAFDALAADDRDLRLVIAGPAGWGSAALDEAVSRAAAGDRVVRAGWVPEGERAWLTCHAAVFAYSSLYEGFGFPPLEAMAAGVPVVATRAGALPEVLGDAAVLVPPADADALAEGLAEVLGDEGLRADLVRRGLGHAASRRWEDTAAGLAALYEDAVGAG